MQIKQTKELGFTLIELLVTLAIIGIIAAMAAPSMTNQINQSKVTDAANTLESALKEARTQAIITQRATRMVLTNTTTDKKATVYYVKKDAAELDIKLAEFSLNKNLVISASPTSLTAVSFTPLKKAYQGEQGRGQYMDENTQFSICYGTSGAKYLVKVDANSNILTEKDGSCS